MSQHHIEAILMAFPWSNYGLDDIEIGLREDPTAQEWLPDLAKAIATARQGNGK